MAAAFSGCTRRVCMKRTAEPVLIFVLLLIYYLVSAISIIITGTVHEAPKLRALCVSQMRKVWESAINSKGPAFLFWELCKTRFQFCGGRPDRHGFVSFEEYVDYTGTVQQFMSDLQLCISLNVWISCAGVKGAAWAWEPEITAMAYLLNTTLAVFSRTNLRKGNHWQFYRPGPGLSLCQPMVLLVNLQRFHFEPVQYYNVP